MLHALQLQQALPAWEMMCLMPSGIRGWFTSAKALQYHQCFGRDGITKRYIRDAGCCKAVDTGLPMM
jgi:hypothetical protein